MRRMNSVKMLLIVFALGFGVFYGMDVATRGVEQINGPAAGHAQAASAVSAAKPTPKPSPTAAAAKTAAAAVKPKEPQQAATLETSFVNRLTDRTGDAIKRLASALMQAISSFFQGVLG